MSNTVAVYFVASPLQYLAAQRIAESFDADARHVLVWYKPGLKAIVAESEWDASAYMPWPRIEPLPGAFGAHRRLRENIRLVAGLVGQCDTLILHSAAYDTEAINYFLHALPKFSGAKEMHARILPDGLLSIRRYPLRFGKRVKRYASLLRALVAPELVYQTYSGDRNGSDADFVDRIYVLPGFPHEYSPEKVVTLSLLPTDKTPALQHGGVKRALVLGQPLTQHKQLTVDELKAVTDEIYAWLQEKGISEVWYKAHHRDPLNELKHDGYKILEIAEPLELHMSKTYYDAVVSVRSSALVFARQIYPPEVDVVAFGWDQVRFESAQEREDMRKVFLASGVQIL